MGKKDEYRFNLRFDETDEMHRLVVKYLNSCGHNKAKYIVRAFLAYIQKDHSEQQLLEKSLQEDHFVNLEGDCKADEAEVLLIKNNYKMFEDLE